MHEVRAETASAGNMLRFEWQEIEDLFAAFAAGALVAFWVFTFALDLFGIELRNLDGYRILFALAGGGIPASLQYTLGRNLRPRSYG